MSQQLPNTFETQQGYSLNGASQNSCTPRFRVWGFFLGRSAGAAPCQDAVQREDGRLAAMAVEGHPSKVFFAILLEAVCESCSWVLGSLPPPTRFAASHAEGGL